MQRNLIFMRLLEILELDKNTKAEKIDADFYNHLNINKKEFEAVFDIEEENISKSNRVITCNLLKLLEHFAQSKAVH